MFTRCFFFFFAVFVVVVVVVLGAEGRGCDVPVSDDEIVMFVTVSKINIIFFKYNVVIMGVCIHDE